jgi:hypothetical protein
MLHAQCLHMGRKRPTVANDKMSRDEIRTISVWVEAQMKGLRDSFDEDFRSKINRERADLGKVENAIVRCVPRGPGAPTLSATTATPSPVLSPEIIK